MIAGELSIRSAAQLHKDLAGALDRGPEVVLDLAQVSSCDTAALQLLFSLVRTANLRGKQARIAALSLAVEEAAAALGLPLTELGGTGAGGDGCGV